MWVTRARSIKPFRASLNQDINKIQRNRKGSLPRLSPSLHRPHASDVASLGTIQRTTCHYCSKIGHLEVVCLKKKRDSHILRGEWRKTQKIFTISKPTAIYKIQVPQLHLLLKLEGQHTVEIEVDTGAGDNFLGKNAWSKLGNLNYRNLASTLSRLVSTSY